jgi:hypothetical protein
MARRKKKASSAGRKRTTKRRAKRSAVKATVVTLRIVGNTLKVSRGASSSPRKRTAKRRTSTASSTRKRKPSTRGAATRSKHDGGVSHKRAEAYGKMAARMGRTVHTATGKRPKGYTKADAIVAQRAAAAERARLGRR